MNKIYKLVWSAARGCYVVASEFAKAHGKSARRAVVGAFVASAMVAGFAGTANAETTYISGANKTGDTEESGIPAYSWIGTGTSAGVVVSDTSGESIYDKGSVYGSFAIGDNVTGNTVTVNGGTINGEVFGGFSKSGAANENTVEIKAGSVSEGSWEYVCGGRSEQGSAAGNNVIINSGNIGKDVYGASASAGASGNTVTITGYTGQIADEIGKSLAEQTTVLHRDLHGAHTGSGDASNNTVTVAGAHVGVDYGGSFAIKLAETDSGNVENNSMTFTNSNIAGYLFGAITQKGSAINNSLEITHSFLSGNFKEICAGTGQGIGENEGKAISNHIIINNVTDHGGRFNNVYGGNASVLAQNNTVKIEYAKVYYNVYGGNAVYIDWEDESVRVGDAIGNEVELLKEAVVEGNVYGGSGWINAQNNKVTLDGANLNNYYGEHSGSPCALYGGKAIAGNATENEVNITNSEVKYDVYGGKSELGSATGNSVIINSGNIGKDVYGAYASTGASGNIVTIKGYTGKIADEIGKPEKEQTTVIHKNLYGASTRSGNASNNIVTVDGAHIGVDGTNKASVFLAKTDSGNVENNSMIITNSEICGLLHVAAESVNGSAIGNTLKIENSILANNINEIIAGKGSSKVLIEYLPEDRQNFNAIGNKLIIDNVIKYELGYYAVGGQALELAKDNEVSIKNAVVGYELFGGKAEYDGISLRIGDAIGNKVELLEGAEVRQNVYGGQGLINAINNSVTLDGARLGNTGGDFALVGGTARDGIAEGNKVSIKNSTVTYDIYGGYSVLGGACQNTVTVEADTTIEKAVYGGYSKTGGVNGNIVTINGGIFGEELRSVFIYGGRADSEDDKGNAIGNKIFVTKLDDGGHKVFLYAGRAFTLVKDNQVFLDDVYSPDLYIKAGSADLLAENNTVSVKNSKLKFVAAGESGQYNVVNNSIEIEGDSTVIYGFQDPVLGDHGVGVVGGMAALGNSVGNVVTIKGGTIKANVYGGFSRSAETEANVVVLTKGTVEGDVYGGYSEYIGDMTANTVTVNGGIVKSNIYGGYTERGNVSGNVVNIASGTVDKDIYAGYAGPYETSTASNNIVNLLGMDGELDYAGTKLIGSSTGLAVGGTVYGSNKSKTDILNLYGTAVTAKNIKNFSNINFNLTSADNATVLHTEEKADLQDVKVKVNVDADATLRKMAPQGGILKTSLLDNGENYNPDNYKYNITASSSAWKRKLDSGLIAGEGTGSLDFILGQYTDNHVELNAAAKEDTVYGGYGITKDATKNSVAISQGSVAAEVYGGYSVNGAVQKNTVTIENATIGADVYGGKSNGTGLVSGNKVGISGSETVVEGSVHGGWSQGKVENNTVTMSGGAVKGSVYGGYSTSGTVSNSIVNLVGNGGSCVVGAETVTGSDLSIDGVVAGANTDNAGNVGNVLNVYGSGIQVGSVANFAALNMYIDSAGDSTEQGLLSSKNVSDMSKTSVKLYADADKLMGSSALFTTLALNGFTGLDAGNVDYVVNVNDEADRAKLDYGLTKDENKLTFAISKFKDNVVTISKSTQAEAIYGGYGVSADKTVENNSLTIKNTISGKDGAATTLYGGYSSQGVAKANTVALKSGTVTGAIYGGQAKTDAVANKVNATGGSVIGNIYGGVGTRDAVENEVSLTASTITGNVYGGVGNGEVAKNKVEILEGAAVTGNVYGSSSKTDTTIHENAVVLNGGAVVGNVYGAYGNKTNKNTVLVQSGTITGDVHGAYSLGQEASSNKVTMEGGSVKGNVYGSKGQAVDQSVVNLAGGTVDENVYGGYGETDLAKNNIVILKGATVNKSIYGGYSRDKQAEYNTVAVAGGTVDNNIYGGYGKETSEHNTVNLVGKGGSIVVNNETVTGSDDGIAMSGTVYGSNNSDNNILNVYGTKIVVGKIDKFNQVNLYLDSHVNADEVVFTSEKPSSLSSSKLDIYADVGKLMGTSAFYSSKVMSGFSDLANDMISYDFVNVDASKKGLLDAGLDKDTMVFTLSQYKDNNAVITKDMQVAKLYGGYGSSQDKVVTNNSLTIDNCSITGVTGSNADIYGGYGVESQVQGNTVTLAGASITGNIYAGFSENGTVGENTVNLVGKDGSCAVGSETVAGNKGVNVSGTVSGSNKGNTGILNVYGSDITVDKVENFKNINLYLDSTVERNKTVFTSKQTSNLANSDLKVYADVGKLMGTSAFYSSKLMDGFSGLADDKVNYKLINVDKSREGRLDVKFDKNSLEFVLSQYKDNEATVIKDMQASNLYGGYGVSHTAENNSLKVDGANVTGNDGAKNQVYGGCSQEGGAVSNAVTLQKGASTDGSVYGGYSQAAGKVEKNTVSIVGSNVKENVYGGYSQNGEAVNNTVNLVGKGGSCAIGSETLTNADKGIEIGGLVAGSNSLNTGNVLNVYGAGIKVGEIQNFAEINLYLSEAVLSDTMLTATNDKENAWLKSDVNIYTDVDKIMGVSAKADLTVLKGYFQIENPNFNISSNKLDKLDSSFTVQQASSGPEWHLVISQREGNAVNIEKDFRGQEIYGGYAMDKTAENNTVSIKNANVGGKTEDFIISIYGGYSHEGSAEHNKVSVTNTSVDGDVYGGYGSNGASHNIVTVVDSSVSEMVYGGRGTGDVSENTVTLVGSDVGRNVYGGFSVKNVAENNTVNLVGKGGSYAIGSETLVGKKGVAVYGTVYGSNTGNSGTLNVYGTENTVGNVKNFANINLYLDSSDATGQAVLTSTSAKVSDLSQSDLKVIANADKLMESSGYYSSTIMSGFKGIDATKNFSYELLSEDASRKAKLEAGVYQDKQNLKLVISQYKDNAVVVEGAKDTATIYGGYATTKTAANNTVTMSGSVSGKETAVDVYGGYSFYGGAEDNVVTMASGTVEGNIYGGYSNGQGLVQNNKVTIAGDTVEGNIYGGYSQEGTAVDNTVNLIGKSGKLDGLVGSDKGLLVDGTVYGSNKDNSGTLNVYGTDIQVEKVQNFANVNLYLDNNWKVNEAVLYSSKESDLSQTVLKVIADADKLLNNSVIFSNEILSGFTGLDATKNFAYELVSKDEARKDLLDCGIIQDNDAVTLVISQCKDSKVTINEDTKSAGIYGGYAMTKTAINNVVTIQGGIIADASDHSASLPTAVYGGYSKNGGAEGNTVVMETGKLYGNIYGGYSNDRGEAKGNTVSLSGGEIKGDVYGGYSKNGTAENNTVNIIGQKGLQQGRSSITLDGLQVTGTVYGSNTGSNNTLNVYGKDSSVGNITNFANINFYLEKGLQNGDSMLAITDGKATELKQTTVNVNMKDIQINVGDSVTLLSNKVGSITEPANVKVNKGTLLTMDASVKLSQDGHSLSVVVDSEPYADDNAKSMAETRAAAVGLINGSVDFFNNVCMKEAMKAAQESEATGKSEVEPFAAVGGNKFRYQTGSYVDMNSWNANVGVAKKLGQLLLGIAGEQAKGNYDSYMDNGLHAEGTAKNTGVVLFAQRTMDKGWYGDLQLRAGRNKSSYSASINDKTLHYDDSAQYYGTSLTVGKKVELNSRSGLNLYGRYAWARLNGSDVAVDTEETMSFASVNSHRLTLGSRWSYELDADNKLYAGMAWQYEFSGAADSRAISAGQSYTVAAPSLRGHSGTLELGWKVEAAKNMAIDLNMSGWTGKQRGVMGGVNMQWKF